MDRHVVRSNNDEGFFSLLSELTPERLGLLTGRTLQATSEQNDRDDYFEDETLVIYNSPSELFGSWWFSEPDCNERLGCDCGPVTLLEVLGCCAPEASQGVLDAHLALVTDLFSHFWSGEALAANNSDELGDACAECLVDGIIHLAEVLNSAEHLALELGEALAAHYAQVHLGTTRFPKT